MQDVSLRVWLPLLYMMCTELKIKFSKEFRDTVVHPKMKRLFQNMNEFLSSAEHKRRYFEECL